MRRLQFVAGIAALSITGWAAAGLTAQGTDAAPEFWPQWRGPHGTGVSRSANPPIEWSETKNVRWKVEIPGRGSASPVVWGDRVYVLTAVPGGEALEASHKPHGAAPSVHKFLVLAIDRASGKTVWERTARE